MPQMIWILRTPSMLSGGKQEYCELSFMQSVLLSMSRCPMVTPGFSGTIVAFRRRLFLLKYFYRHEIFLKPHGEMAINAKKCNELFISCCESLSTFYLRLAVSPYSPFSVIRV